MEEHHGDMVSKTQEVGNATGQRTHFFNRWEGKEAEREPKDSRRLKRHISQMIVSELFGFRFGNNFFKMFGEI